MRGDLSVREAQVVGLVAEGLGNKEIAHRLSISTATTASHVQEAMRKARCTNRTQLAVWWSTGLSQPTAVQLAEVRGIVRGVLEGRA